MWKARYFWLNYIFLIVFEYKSVAMLDADELRTYWLFF